MDTLDSRHVSDLASAVAAGLPLHEAFPRHVGGRSAGNGAWRFFSPAHPGCGISDWNTAWREAWGVATADVSAFGEDVFGNQILAFAGRATVVLFDHESGGCHDLELGPVDLLSAVAEHGVSWIDSYGNGALAVAEGLSGSLDWEHHIHWTLPLILGGAIDAGNTSVVERHAHVRGHAKLRQQISGLPPGSETRLR